MTSVRRNSEPPAKCLNMFYVIIRMPTNLPFNILAYRLVNLVKIGHVDSRKRMAKNRNLSYRRQALKEILVCRNNALIGGKTKCVKMNETLNQWKAL